MAEAAAAAVGGVARGDAGPGFHVDAVAHVVGADVADGDVLDDFVDAVCVGVSFESELLRDVVKGKERGRGICVPYWPMLPIATPRPE